jgi:hypothetical protein
LQVNLLQKQYQVLCYWQDTLVLRWHLGMGIQNPTPLPLRVVKMDQYHFLRPSAAAVASGFGCAFLCMRTRVAAAACSNRYTHCTFSLMGAQIRVFSLSLPISFLRRCRTVAHARPQHCCRRSKALTTMGVLDGYALSILNFSNTFWT